ncbi:MAG: hypothetical protein H6709_23070 [Kofleriaceae bacterium]|nr:hypothetical protein [Kofleriaceae bacterium]MCB9574966.1 hypothetical protein [Kofleriaceae bacterium]
MRSLASTISVLMLVLAGCGQDTPSSGDDDTPAADATVQPPGDGTPSIDAAPGPDAAPARDTGEPGEWDVNVATASATTSLGTAGLTIYTPSSDGGTSPAAGPWPLVVVSTGFQIGRTNYDATCRHLASWGYLTISHDYTSGNHQEKAAEVSELIDWALGGSSGLAARIDAGKIAVAGHSMGGKVSILTAIEDDRVGAVVGWDPVDALPPFGNDGSTSVAPERMAELTVPFAVLGETTDGSGSGQACAPADDNYTQYFGAACNAPATLEVTIAGADHTDWVDSRSSCGLACLFCATGATDDATVLTITRRVTVAWLQTYLRGLGGYGPYLTTPGIGSPASIRTTVPGCP